MNRQRRRRIVAQGLLLGLALFAAACSDDDQKKCELDTDNGCDDGFVCQAVVGAEPACFRPLTIEGRVFDIGDDTGIGGATIVALDANGGARTSAVQSAADGEYSLFLSSTRQADGTPVDENVTLRVSAQGYQPFPVAPRTALPISLGEAVGQDDAWIVRNATTDVALLGLPGDVGALGQVAGRIVAEGLDGEQAGGVLMVAEVDGTAVSTAVTDADGAFVLNNVPAGDVVVTGYRSGLGVAASTVNVRSGQTTEDVELQARADQLATVTGSVAMVDAPGGSTTSVLLVVESTFDDLSGRGEAPAGLRAAGVTGAFSIANVPPGRYVVLAAFENDGLVRDPDQTIGGTAIVRIEVDGADVATAQSFKVTGALAVDSPGADQLEIISDSHPTFRWADDSSEDGYELRVFDAFGTLVHEDTAVPRVTGSETVSYTWSDAQLEPGMIYQFRVVSWREKKGGGSGRTYISATEDLRGVFQFQP